MKLHTGLADTVSPVRQVSVIKITALFYHILVQWCSSFWPSEADEDCRVYPQVRSDPLMPGLGPVSPPPSLCAGIRLWGFCATCTQSCTCRLWDPTLPLASPTCWDWALEAFCCPHAPGLGPMWPCTPKPNNQGQMTWYRGPDLVHGLEVDHSGPTSGNAA